MRLTPFSLEQHLVEHVRSSATLRAGTSNVDWYQVGEFPLGRKIADVVFAAFQGLPTTLPANKTMSRLNYLELRVLAEIVEGPVGGQGLVRRLHMQRTSVDGILRRLLRADLIVEDGRRFRTAGWERALPLSLISVEAKLRDWRSAVEQACYYKRFSDFAYVLMPSDPEREGRVSAECRSHGIGYLQVYPNHVIVHRVAPKRVPRLSATSRTLTRLSVLQRRIQSLERAKGGSCHARRVQPRDGGPGVSAT